MAIAKAINNKPITISAIFIMLEIVELPESVTLSTLLTLDVVDEEELLDVLDDVLFRLELEELVFSFDVELDCEVAIFSSMA